MLHLLWQPYLSCIIICVEEKPKKYIEYADKKEKKFLHYKEIQKEWGAKVIYD
jgi:hypothetical protein